MIRLRPSGVDEILIKRVRDWYEPGPGVFIFGNAATAFSPTILFASGEQGAWYDPSDLTTLFQDSAGTTPVTAVEQPVGAMLDKRDTAYSVYFDGSGDYLSNQSSNAVAFGTGDFTIEYWIYPTAFSATYGNHVGCPSTANGFGVGNFNNTGEIYGTTYATGYQTGSLLSLNVWTHVAWTRSGTTLRAFKNGTQIYSTTVLTSFTDTGFGVGAHKSGAYVSGSMYLSNLRVVKGTALYTANFTPPTAPLTPVAGTSLLTCSTTWSGNPAITAVGDTKVSNLNPFKTGTGNHAFQTTSANRPVLSARVNKLLNTETLATQSVTTVAASHTLRFTGTGSITLSGTATGTYTAGTYTITTTAGTLTLTVSGTVTQADLRVANQGVNLPPYQRVGAEIDGTPTVPGNGDYDTTGFPLYLKANGTNSAMQTNSINFGVDKMTVVAGVRKLSDALTGMLVELSAQSGANNGCINISGNVSGTYGFRSRGTNTADAISGVYAAPITNVIAGIGDTNGSPTDTAILRVNGIQAASVTTDQGTLNYGNYPLYLFARAGTSLWLDGYFYGLIVRGAQSSAAEIANAETWMNSKTKAY